MIPRWSVLVPIMAETEIESYTHDLGGFNLGVGLGALTNQEGVLDHTITLNYVVEPGTATSEDYRQVFSTRRTPTVVVTPGTIGVQLPGL